MFRPEYSRLLTFSIILFLLGMVPAVAQEKTARSNHASDSLSEIQYQDRALLVVLRSGVVSADPENQDVLDFVLKADPQPRARYRSVYGVIAKKLNDYIRKYRSLNAANQLGDADCVIFFNLVEYRRILNTVYPFGELYVIVKGEPEQQKPPRVIWKSRKVTWVADAADELIKELKNVRKEF